MTADRDRSQPGVILEQFSELGAFLFLDKGLPCFDLVSAIVVVVCWSTDLQTEIELWK